MRDYRKISAEEFTVESLDMKLRWLARRLRKIDNPGEIVQWVTVVSSLHRLKQSFKKKSTNSVSENTEPTLKPISERKYFSISAPNSIEWSRNEVKLSIELIRQSQLT